MRPILVEVFIDCLEKREISRLNVSSYIMACLMSTDITFSFFVPYIKFTINRGINNAIIFGALVIINI